MCTGVNMARDVRPVDGDPARDVAGRDVVGVALVAALDAAEPGLRGSVLLAGVPAAGAASGSVARIDVGGDGDPVELGLVDGHLLELGERPGVQCAALRPFSPDPPADALEILEGDPAAGAFGPAHKLVGDPVVGVGGEPPLASRTAPQEAAGGARALLLQPPAEAARRRKPFSCAPAARLPSESVAMFTTPRSAHLACLLVSAPPETGPAGRWQRATPKTRLYWSAGALLFLALLIRVGYVLHSHNYRAVLDAGSYDLLGTGLAHGHGWVLGASAYRPPGLPFFLAGVYLILGVPHGVWTETRLVLAVLSTVTVALIGLMVLQVAGRRAALISIAIAAVYVPLVVVGTALMTEALFVPLVLGATNCALYSRGSVHRCRWVALAGFLTGLASLTRGNGLVVGMALAVIVWGPKPRLSWRAAAAPALLIALMALTVAPWTVRNAIAQHAFVPVTTELGPTLTGTYNDLAAKHHFIWVIGGYRNYHAIQTNSHLSEAQRNSRELSAVLHYIGHHPTYPIQAMFWNTMRLFDLQGLFVAERSAHTDTDTTEFFAHLGVFSFWVLGLLALGGLFTRAVRRIPLSLWIVPFVIWLSEAPITTGTPRFRAALDPFIILLAALAIEAVVLVLLPRRREPARVSGEFETVPAPAGSLTSV